MPLTPQQQAEIDKLDKDLQETETIKRIYKNQEDMIQGLNDERELNKSEFARGREKFKEIFTELKEVKSEVKGMKEDYKKGVKEIVDTIHNKELSDLRVEIRDVKQKEKDMKAFWNGVAKTVLSAAIIAIVLFGLSKIGITAP